MSVSLFTFRTIVSGVTTSRSCGVSNHIGNFVAIQRAPTDPFYYANVDIENMVVGSRWMLGYTPSGGEFTELASGTAATSAFTIPNVPSYASPMLLELRVRKASGAPKYEPLRQYANHSPNGVNMYLAQQLDEIAL